MNKREYLDALRRALAQMPGEEKEKQLAYYDELIQDMCEDGMNETEATARLGEPDTVAQELLAALPLWALVKTRVRPSGGFSPLVIALLVLGFPLISWWLYTMDNPLWLSLNNVFFGIFLFFLGRVWRWVMERLKRRNTIVVSLLMLGVFVWLNATWPCRYTMSSNAWSGEWWVILLATVTSLCGLSGLLLSLHTPRIPLVNYIGEHSMVFFVAHYPMLVLYKLIRTANVRSLRGHWDDYTILLLVLFGVCLLLVP